MTIDFSQAFKSIDDTGSFVELKEKGRLITLSVVAYSALLQPDDRASQAEKLDRFKLAFRIAQTSSTLEVSLEDAALIKKLIGENPSPLIVGQAFEMLENSTKERE